MIGGFEGFEMKDFVVFTSLAPIVFLTVRNRWPVLADLARCTPQLLRNPQGGVGDWKGLFKAQLCRFAGLVLGVHSKVHSALASNVAVLCR